MERGKETDRAYKSECLILWQFIKLREFRSIDRCMSNQNIWLLTHSYRVFGNKRPRPTRLPLR